MKLTEAISILKEHNYAVRKPLLNERDLHFSTADQFSAFMQSRPYFQNTVKIGVLNTVLSEKELNDTGEDIGKIVIERYCKDYESAKKDLQEAWDMGWESEDPNPMTEEAFKKLKSKKAVYEECNEIYQKGAIMHAFLNNF